jgi:hypothetical protein
MIDPIQQLLVFNIVCVVLVAIFVRRILKASSKFNWNPGDGAIQGKQQLIILQTIVILAFIVIVAAIANVLFV